MAENVKRGEKSSGIGRVVIGVGVGAALLLVAVVVVSVAVKGPSALSRVRPIFRIEFRCASRVMIYPRLFPIALRWKYRALLARRPPGAVTMSRGPISGRDLTLCGLAGIPGLSGAVGFAASDDRL